MDCVRYDPIRIEHSRRRMIRLINAGGICAGRPRDFSGWLRERKDSMSPGIEPDTELANYGCKEYGLNIHK